MHTTGASALVAVLDQTAVEGSSGWAAAWDVGVDDEAGAVP